jgi:ABC-type lipoprotein export system ATPase subunit
VSLKDIDLHIKKGEFTCIIGECGSGKSTLLSTIIGDLLYVDPAILTKYGSSVSGLNHRFKSKTAEGRAELRQVASELVDGVAKLYKPPIRLNGSLAYAQ